MPFQYQPPAGSASGHAAFARLLSALLILALLAGCAQWLEPFFPGLFPGESTPGAPANGAARTPTPEMTPTFEPLPTISGPVTLTVWVPPQFDPQGDSAAGSLLQERIDAFMEQTPGVLVNVRVKAPSGPGGLLEALTASSAAAPGALPSLVALNRTDLEAAALKGLIYPIEGLSGEIDSADWYPYARQLGAIQGSPFGFAFAGDALVLVYRPSVFGGQTPDSWESILFQGAPMIFHADDSQAVVTTTLYRSAGGEVQDIQGRPTLQLEPLEAVLRLYAEGARGGTFPASLTQYQTAGQAWQAYSEGQADWAVTWSSNFLANLPPDSRMAPLPPLGEEAYTQATGWVWALADPDQSRHETALALAEFLTQSEFLAEWNAEAGYLPTRPTALAGWPNQSVQSLLNQVVLSARIRPANEIQASLGPILKEATVAVIRDLGDPLQTAQSSLDKLGAP